MKLLIVMASGQLRGGAEEALLQYVASHTYRENPLTIAVLERGPLVQALRERGARVIVIQSGQLRQPHLWLRTILRLTTLARREGFDFIFSWISKGHLYAGPAAAIAKLPVAYFQHGLPDEGFVDRLCRKIPAVGALGCSSFVAQEQGQKVDYLVLAVPMAADLARFEPARLVSAEEMKLRFGFDPARPLVGIVGRLQNWKGIHVFAEAFAHLKQTHPEVQGVIVGGAWEHELEYETVLQELIERLGVGDSLKMVGLQRNVPQWMQAMDVIVHASQREPFGIVVVEAMSLGKPTIATIPGGPAEIIEPGISGQLVTWNNSEELAQAMERYLVEPEFAATCAKGAYLRAQQFSPAKFSALVNSALEELAQKPRKKSLFMEKPVASDTSFSALLRADVAMMMGDRPRKPLVNALLLLSKLLIYPRYQAIVLFRLSQRLYHSPLSPLSYLLQSWVLAISGAEIHPAAKIGPGFTLVHTSGIVIGDQAVVGRCFRCFHGVTLGDSGKGDGQPVLGDHVTAYAGSKILGGITVGDYAAIGANAVLMIDVPAYGVAVGVPARVVKVRFLEDDVVLI